MNNFIELAERFMEEARACGNDQVLTKVASAVEAILAHFREEEKPAPFVDNGVRFVIPDGSRTPSFEKLVDKWGRENLYFMETNMMGFSPSKQQALQAVVNKLGSWASAAQDDPGCCAELKAIFLELLDLCDQPEAEEDILGLAGPGPGPIGEPGPEGEPGTTALDVLRKMNDLISLGDLCYYIRQREAKGWEGPKVVAWGIACARMKQLFKKAEQAKSYTPKYTTGPSGPYGAGVVLLSHQHNPEPVPTRPWPTRPWPKDWPLYRHRNEPCNMLIGPCSCGAWHSEGEFYLQYASDGTVWVERQLPTSKLPPTSSDNHDE